MYSKAIGTIKPGFHTLVSDARIVSVAECFVKRSGRLYGNTLAIASNDSLVRSESIVPIEQCSILASRFRDYKFCDRNDLYAYLNIEDQERFLSDFVVPM